ncbi:MAG: HIT domain-containing protein [Simkaniaceae bacterium]|jgi:diadenosine tetraphosphate (Ap4A) HIT family hydrolase|nr:MAG: HIT domain-containing protein [Simkaniaceae bacterium]
MSFKLHQNFLSKIFLHNFPLCKVLLEDERHYPWLLLIPRRNHVSKLVDLSSEDQLQLNSELNLAQQILLEKFHPDQLNIAAIGNITPQLHIHVIARFKDDPAWPYTVWDHPIRASYSNAEREDMIQALREAFIGVTF